MPEVLLVDDDDSVLFTLSVLIEDEGFEVTTATNLDGVRSFLSGGGRCTAALLDLNLGRESAMDVVPNLAETLPDCKIVILTGAVPDSAERSPQVHAYFQKGDDPEPMLDYLKSL